MNTVITHNRIKRYVNVLNDLLTVAEIQAQHRVRRPCREIVDLLDAMTNVCVMLNCQVMGGPQPKHHDIEAIKQQAARAMEFARRLA
ncbi:hypothetical protein [Paraburkholderia hayleyella]|uniref:hypothetical protein n=1 Tax=Paraburkholderia hayleyella TaxID=2152889 RepID=UPI0012922530|nr:hypothetical protein [Paraburkholderia hayleyella]